MNIKKGEVWEVEFFPNKGSEIGKKRPAIVVSNNLVGKLPLKTIVPITNWQKSFEDYPWIFKLQPSNLNGLSKLSGADCFQVRNFSHERFIKKIGEIDSDNISCIDQIVIKTLDPKYKLC